MRALGIDWGERRIGIAVSDPTGTIASPRTTLTRRKGKRPPFAALERIAHEAEVSAVVMGLPLTSGGAEDAWCTEVRSSAEEIGRRLDVPVHFVDERMTSARAERAVRALGLPRGRREEKGRVDAAAAALILQAWLDGGGRD